MGCFASRPEGDGRAYDAATTSGVEPARSDKTSDAEDRGESLVGLQLRAKGMTERHTAAASVDGSKESSISEGSGELAGARSATEEDLAFIRSAMENTVLFRQLDPDVREGVAREMRRAEVSPEHKLIIEGDLGDKLYLVEEGIFDVLSRRNGVDVKVNSKSRGDIFGEISLLLESPRTATVVSASRGAVWVLDRARFRALTRKAAVESNLQNEVFLNSVPAFADLDADARFSLAEALVERRFDPGQVVVREGDVNADTFYLVVRGEAIVTVREKDTLTDGEGVGASGEVGGASGERVEASREGADDEDVVPGRDAATTNRAGARSGDETRVKETAAGTGKVVNHLFRADFFGERALLESAPRNATVTAAGTAPLVCLCLDRDDFAELLGSLQDRLAREKSPEVVARRMMELSGRVPWLAATATVTTRRGEKEHASGTCSNATFSALVTDDGAPVRVVLKEGALLGGGASGSVRTVDCALGAGGVTRRFALKRMLKTNVMSTPEHVYCEQSITKELDHFTCMRQHASFQDEHYLYFLFDYVDGCDLMDALAAVATVKPFKNPQKMFAPKIKMLQGMPEKMAMYYVAVIASALEYLHEKNIVYRDLKPENVLLGMDGSAKLGDFGFAKKLEKGSHTYTFCGTPGYVAPEVVLARGYGTSVDWWGLGVLMYVLLTGQQPFSQLVNGQPEEPLTVMKRIVDRSWAVSFPMYVSESAVDIMSWFLERRSVRRLGNLRRKAEDVREHAWFRDAGFDWDLLRSGKMRPRPLALSDAFASQHRSRIRNLEREVAATRPSRNQAKVRVANDIFKDF